MTVRPALVLTGPPAVGKSTVARTLAAARPRCAVIEVDDLRQLVHAGAAAPWEGAEGARQRLLGARNACAVAANFLAYGIEVVITDVVTTETAASYRRMLPGCLVVRLTATLSEAQRRAASREARLTTAEFEALHEQDAVHPPRVDVTIDVTDLDPRHEARVIEVVWADEQAP
jgi:predicted kinase